MNYNSETTTPRDLPFDGAAPPPVPLAGLEDQHEAHLQRVGAALEQRDGLVQRGVLGVPVSVFDIVKLSLHGDIRLRKSIARRRDVGCLPDFQTLSGLVCVGAASV